jgi:hypothetical protein
MFSDGLKKRLRADSAVTLARYAKGDKVKFEAAFALMDDVLERSLPENADDELWECLSLFVGDIVAELMDRGEQET